MACLPKNMGLILLCIQRHKQLKDYIYISLSVCGGEEKQRFSVGLPLAVYLYKYSDFLFKSSVF